MRRGITLTVVMASLYALCSSAQLASGTPPSWGRPHTIELELEPKAIAVGDTVRFVVCFTPCEDVESLQVWLGLPRPVGATFQDSIPATFRKYARKGETLRILELGVFHCPGLYGVSVYYSHLDPRGYPLPVSWYEFFRIRVPGGLVQPGRFEGRFPLKLQRAPLRMGYPCGQALRVEIPAPRSGQRDDTTGLRSMISNMPTPIGVPSSEDSLLSVEYSACVDGYSCRISISEDGDFRYLEYEERGKDGGGDSGRQVRSSVVGQVPVHAMSELLKVVTEECFMTWHIGEEDRVEPVGCDSDYEYLAVTIRGRMNSITTHEPLTGPISRIREKLCDIKMKIEGSR